MPISREQLRTFHVTGAGLEEYTPAGPLRPEGLGAVPVLESRYPLWLSTTGEGPLARPLAEVLEGAVPTDEVAAAVRAIRDAVGDGGCVPMSKALEAVTGAFPVQKVRRDGLLVPFTRHALAVLLGAALGAVRRKAREDLRQRAMQAYQQMKDLLAVDDSHSADAASAESIAAALGAQAESFFDAGAFAQAVQRPAKGVKRLVPGRRARVAITVEQLEQYLRDSAQDPVFWLFHSGAEPAGIAAVGGRSIPNAGGFSAPVDFCRQMLGKFKLLLQALRVARLEADSAYVPEQHDDPVARLDWQSAEPQELAALPAVVVWEQGSSVTDFGRVLRSGLPIHVLISDTGSDPAKLNELIPDFGQVAMAHREAFVLEGSLSAPERLTAGLQEMVAVPGTAVAVVAVPPGDETEWLEWAVSVWLARSGAQPAFRYHPGRGSTWAERLEVHSVDGDESLTPAHAFALMDGFRRHFRVLPETAWSDEQIDLNQYLKRYTDRPPLAIPYLWVVDGQGVRQRAAITRELAYLCHDRRVAHRMLLEMAGVGNSFVDGAVARVREELEKAAQAREEAAIDKGRQEGARNAVARLVMVLTNPASAVPTVAKLVPVAVPQVVAKASVPAADAPVAEAAPAGDPYIDSFLCTSCNDCMKVNPKLFLYNGEKQAYIGDPTAGTFAELVKAAEGCPAKCIHPGKPRPGDTSATPALVARAAKFG